MAYVLSPLEVYVSLLPFPVKLLHVIIATYLPFFTSYPLYNPLPSGIGSDLSQKHFAKITNDPQSESMRPFLSFLFLELLTHVTSSSFSKRLVSQLRLHRYLFIFSLFLESIFLSFWSYLIRCLSYSWLQERRTVSPQCFIWFPSHRVSDVPMSHSSDIILERIM